MEVWAGAVTLGSLFCKRRPSATGVMGKGVHALGKGASGQAGPCVWWWGSKPRGTTAQEQSRVQERGGGTEGDARFGGGKVKSLLQVVERACQEGAPDLAHIARPKSQGHTRSVPPWWPRPGSGRGGTAGPHRGPQVPQPGCTEPPSTHPGTGSCRKERRGAHTSRGHT